MGVSRTSCPARCTSSMSRHSSASSTRMETHPIVAATERAAGTAACSRAAISYQHYSTAECDRQPKIADLLCRGQENAVPLRNLESMTGLDGRTIRAMIATERRAGIAVLSDNATGYYLPANEEEKARFVRSMRHRAKEILLAADAVERT